MCDIRPGLTNVPVHLAHDTNMLITVQQRVLFVPTRTAASTVGGPVSLQAGIGENNNQALGVLVMRGDGSMLLSDELRQLRRRAGLSP